MLDGGRHTGRAICAVVQPDSFTIGMNDQGMLEARLRPTADTCPRIPEVDVETVCPARAADEMSKVLAMMR